MAKKLTKKTIVDVETGEVEATIDELLEAKEIFTAKLGKAYNKKANVEAEINSMELTLNLIEQKLEEAGYEPGDEE